MVADTDPNKAPSRSGKNMMEFKALFSRCRFEVSMAVSCAFLAFSPRWYPGLTWVLLVVVGLVSAILLSGRIGDDVVLVKIVVASYLIRVLLTLVLFAISAWHLPILPSLHREYGLWQFGGDGVAYHQHALKILDAWRAGIDLPSVFREGQVEYNLYRDLSLPIAAVYKILGAFPLHFMLVNAWLGALTAILSYLIAKRLADGRGARIAAGLVAFWPSAILWSTQLLKDTIMLVLILMALFLLIVVWQETSGVARMGGRIRGILLWLALVSVVIALTRFRFYTGYVLFASVGGAMGIAFGTAASYRRWRQALTALGLIIGVGGSTLIARSIDPLKLFSPPNPEVGHVSLGLEYQRKGDLERAVTEYQRAIELNHRYAQAYYSLGMTLTEQGKMEGAVEAYQNYVALETNPEARKLVQGLLARIRTPVEALKAAEAPKPELAEVHEFAKLRKVAEVGYEVGQAIRKIPDQVREMVRFASPGRINVYRQDLIAWGGHSLVDSTVVFSSLWDVLIYLPRGVAVALLAPFPWQWFYARGETGIFRSLSAIEVILVYFLLPAMISACGGILKRHREEGWLLVAFIALTAVSLGLTVANVGTLFRLRLQFVLPLIIVTGISELPGPYKRLLDVLGWKVGGGLRQGMVGRLH